MSSPMSAEENYRLKSEHLKELETNYEKVMRRKGLKHGEEKTQCFITESDGVTPTDIWFQAELFHFLMLSYQPKIAPDAKVFSAKIRSPANPDDRIVAKWAATRSALSRWFLEERPDIFKKDQNSSKKKGYVLDDTVTLEVPHESFRAIIEENIVQDPSNPMSEAEIEEHAQIILETEGFDTIRDARGHFDPNITDIKTWLEDPEQCPYVKPSELTKGLTCLFSTSVQYVRSANKDENGKWGSMFWKVKLHLGGIWIVHKQKGVQTPNRFHARKRDVASLSPSPRKRNASAVGEVDIQASPTKQVRRE